jgi:glutamyl-tRNA(Gln) amidotransferase subunit E
MYVETDIPSKPIHREFLEKLISKLPELPDAKKERIMETYKLTDDIATSLVKQDRVEYFEMIMNQVDVNPVVPASNLAYTFKELKREGCDIGNVNVDVLVDIYKYVEDDTIPAASTTILIRDACNGITPSESMEKHGLKKMDDDEVEAIISDLIGSNEGLIKERGMAAMGSLMGMAMKDLKGKADGKLVSRLIKERLLKMVERK